MQWFNNLSIKKRFALIGSLVLFFISILIAVSFWGFIRFHTVVTNIQEDQIPEILNLKQAAEQIQTTRVELYAAIFSTNQTNRTAHLAEVRKSMELVQTTTTSYTSGTHPAEEQANIQRLNEHLKSWLAEITSLSDLAQLNTPEAYSQAATILEQSPNNTFITELNAVITINEDELKATKQDVSDTFISIIIASLSCTAIILLIVFGALWLLAHSIIQMTQNIQQLNQGIRQALVASEKNRQVGDKTSTDLKSITNELGANAVQVVSRSQDQARSVLEVTSNINELAATSRQIATNSKQVALAANNSLIKAQSVSEISNLASLSADKGQVAVTKAVEAIELVSAGLRAQTISLNELDAKSKRISSIIGMIKTIADETHLLSLNAAIESAGTVLSGERFAVVASQIKTLANRSLAATKEVSEIISDLQNAVTTAVLASEETSFKTISAVERSYQSSAIIKELKQVVQETAYSGSLIEEATRQVVVLADEISLGTQQQESAVRQIITIMENLEKTAQENANAVSEISITVHQIDHLSTELKETLSRKELLAA